MRQVPNRYPRISVVTPSFNQVQFLEEAIRSVLDQGYPNLEYVIIDGGSTDGSVDIIRRYEKSLTYWVSEPDRGHGHALNKGFRHTTGEIMAWLNSDDKYLPWTFAIVSEVFSIFADVNWIVGVNAWWDDHGRLTDSYHVYKNMFDFLRGTYGWIQQESTFWRRPLWERAGGRIDDGYEFMVDGELWTRFFTLDKLWHVNHIIGGYRQHGSNRARLHLDTVRAEMDQAIDVMRQRLSPDELRVFRRMRLIRWMKLNGRVTFVEPLVRRVLKRLYATLAYDRLVYSEGEWFRTSGSFTI